jgi:hypothetical protein
MAIIVFDGFDHYAAQADLQARVGALQWNVLNGGASFVTGRGGYGQALQIESGLSGFILIGSFNQNLGGAIAAIAAYVLPDSLDGANAFLDFQAMDYTSGLPQLTVRILLSSGTVLVYLGDVNGPLITTTPPNACNPFVFQKYELKAVIGPSGSLDFHVNGSSVFPSPPAGINTQATGNAWFNGLQLRGGFIDGDGGPIVQYDDFNLNDLTTGPGTYPCNSFLGDVATRTLFTAANSSVSWTPYASTNWVEVGEIQFDGDTSYNFTTTPGAQDIFSFNSLPADVAAVFAVQVTGAYRKLDASNQTIQQGVTTSATYAAGAMWPMSLAYSYVTDLFTVSPATAATWTTTEVNALLGSYQLNS